MGIQLHKFKLSSLLFPLSGQTLTRYFSLPPFSFLFTSHIHLRIRIYTPTQFLHTFIYVQHTQPSNCALDRESEIKREKERERGMVLWRSKFFAFSEVSFILANFQTVHLPILHTICIFRGIWIFPHLQCVCIYVVCLVEDISGMLFMVRSIGKFGELVVIWVSDLDLVM